MEGKKKKKKKKKVTSRSNEFHLCLKKPGQVTESIHKPDFVVIPNGISLPKSLKSIP